MSNQSESASQFRALHAKGKILVLANAWDAASARIAEDCGAEAIATSSAAVAWAHGYADGEAITADMLLGFVREITRIVRIPVSVDSEEGYSSEPAKVAAFVGRLIDAGAVGMNLEDGKEPPELLARKIGAIRKEVVSRGTDFFVNARTDVYLKALVPADRALAETLTRGKLYKQAGADGFFVPGVVDTATMREIADTIDLPLNVLTWKDLPAVGTLKQAGVRRLSAGGGMARAAYGAMRRAALELLKEGRYDAMNAAAQDCPNLNGLM